MCTEGREGGRFRKGPAVIVNTTGGLRTPLAVLKWGGGWLRPSEGKVNFQGVLLAEGARLAWEDSVGARAGSL